MSTEVTTRGGSGRLGRTYVEGDTRREGGKATGPEVLEDVTDGSGRGSVRPTEVVTGTARPTEVVVGAG